MNELTDAQLLTAIKAAPQVPPKYVGWHNDQRIAEACEIIKADRAQRQAEQEPVAWRFHDTGTLVPAMPGYEPLGDQWVPLYAAPQPVKQP